MSLIGSAEATVQPSGSIILQCTAGEQRYRVARGGCCAGEMRMMVVRAMSRDVLCCGVELKDLASADQLLRSTAA